MISIGGVIGTGLFLGTASSLASGYTIVSSVCIGSDPVAGGQVTLSGWFVDPALAFAMGWNYWYSYVVLLPTELSAAAVLINFWNKSINNTAWISICLVVVATINFLGTQSFGECEFWFASIKVLTIVGLIILGIVIDLGGAPCHDCLGFRFWHHPGAFVQFQDIAGAKGRFLGFWSVLILMAYAFLGTDILGMTAAEMRNPSKNIPRAIIARLDNDCGKCCKGVYVRILVFYILGVFVLGLIWTGTAASSVWVVAIKTANIKALPSIINACLLTSAWSAGSSDLYTSSRFDWNGTSNSNQDFGLLAYMGVSGGSSKVFTWFANMSAVTGMLNWMGICITLLRFRAGLKAQGHYRLQPYVAWWSFGWTIVIILFAHWSVFLRGSWDTAGFITNYLPIPVFIILYFGYKIAHKTKIIPVDEMDFVTFANYKW
ncbi:hypothetical protein K439DRAFT_1505471 [Ramaria rubella]|nr:hypothetical protein K439DRAFT_1505471 [Ramaria rubella]